MALSASTLASLIQANLAAQGAVGSNLSKFCNAIGKGVVESIVGKAFTTADVGLIPGIGVGTGTGIQGLSSAIMKSTALSLMSSRGVNADKMMQAIMDAVVTHLSSAATLSSTHAPVFSGSGTVVPGSIAVVAAQMSSNIDSELSAQGAVGVNKTNLATAIGTGIANNILSSGTGTVAISGSFTGPTPPGPIPGAGSGAGTIS
jgi:hypothetical protein